MVDTYKACQPFLPFLVVFDEFLLTNYMQYITIQIIQIAQLIQKGGAL
jgi:hypothetical protein